MGGSLHLGNVQGADVGRGEAKMSCSRRELGALVHLVSFPNHVYVLGVHVGLDDVGREFGVSCTKAHLVFCPSHVVLHAVGVVGNQRGRVVAEPVRVAEHVVGDHALVVDQLEGEDRLGEPFFDEGVLWGRSFMFLQGSLIRSSSSSSSSSIRVPSMTGLVPEAGAAVVVGVEGAEGAEDPDEAAGS